VSDWEAHENEDEYDATVRDPLFVSGVAGAQMQRDGGRAAGKLGGNRVTRKQTYRRLARAGDTNDAVNFVCEAEKK
jgi:hypothetical protein